jgi:hypothetical protein
MIKLIINGEELEKYRTFQDKHNKKHNPEKNPFFNGAIGGGYEIIILPTSIGDVIIARCLECKQEIVLQGLS